MNPTDNTTSPTTSNQSSPAQSTSEPPILNQPPTASQNPASPAPVSPNPNPVPSTGATIPNVAIPDPAQVPSLTQADLKTPKTNKITRQWYFWVIIVLGFFCIVSLVLAGFVWNDNATSHARINELTATLDEKNNLLAKYAAQLGQNVEDSSRPGYVDGADPQNFLIVTEWGLKFKIPEGLNNISYIFKTITTEATETIPSQEYQMFCVTGIPSEATATPEYYKLDINTYSLGCLLQSPDNNLGLDSAAKSVYQNGTSYYFYSAPTKYVAPNEDEKAIEIHAIELVQDLLARNVTKL